MGKFAKVPETVRLIFSNIKGQNRHDVKSCLLQNSAIAVSEPHRGTPRASLRTAMQFLRVKHTQRDIQEMYPAPAHAFPAPDIPVRYLKNLLVLRSVAAFQQKTGPEQDLHIHTHYDASQ